MKKEKKDYYHVLVDDEFYACNFTLRKDAERVVKDVKKRDKYSRVYIIIAPYHHNYVFYLIILFCIILLIVLFNLIKHVLCI